MPDLARQLSDKDVERLIRIAHDRRFSDEFLGKVLRSIVGSKPIGRRHRARRASA